MHAFINVAKLCKLLHVKMTSALCTVEVSVKVRSFQKVTLFLRDKIFNRDFINLRFVCLKMLLTAVI